MNTIIGKIIHLSDESVKRATSGRSSETYDKRKNFILSDTIPKLESININASFFDAVPYPDLEFDRNYEHKIHNPKLEIEYLDHKYLVDNPFSSAWELSLYVGHYLLWKESVRLNVPILILEDDILVKDDNLSVISSSIQAFTAISEPAILYLQSTTPYIKPIVQLKSYSHDRLITLNSLYLVNSDHADWSGTAAYIVNPSGAKQLIERGNTVGGRCADGFIHRAIQEKYVNAYIPIQYTRGIHLHPDYA
jgi:GR25 family glycosyltransferase involved in LPS biosynthesis